MCVIAIEPIAHAADEHEQAIEHQELVYSAARRIMPACSRRRRLGSRCG